MKISNLSSRLHLAQITDLTYNFITFGETKIFQTIYLAPQHQLLISFLGIRSLCISQDIDSQIKEE